MVSLDPFSIFGIDINSRSFTFKATPLEEMVESTLENQ